MRENKLEEIEFSKKDYICMAEILQSVLFRDEIFGNCCRCTFSEECLPALETPEQLMHIDILREKLWKYTGIYLGIHNNAELIDAREKSYHIFDNLAFELKDIPGLAHRTQRMFTKNRGETLVRMKFSENLNFLVCSVNSTVASLVVTVPSYRTSFLKFDIGSSPFWITRLLQQPVNTL